MGRGRPQGAHGENGHCRLVADADLLVLLKRDDFSGPNWIRFCEEAGAYGFQVLRGWIFTGQISIELARRKVRGAGGIEARGLRYDRDIAGSLAGETAAVGLVKFREHVLKTGDWNPNGGASLKTFYINQCLFQFPAVYRRWHAAENRCPPGLDLAHDRALQPLQPNDPETILINSEHEREFFSLVPDPINRSIIILRLEGYTYAEIGEILGLGEDAVGQRWRRWRRRSSRLVEAIRQQNPRGWRHG